MRINLSHDDDYVILTEKAKILILYGQLLDPPGALCLMSLYVGRLVAWSVTIYFTRPQPSLSHTN